MNRINTKNKETNLLKLTPFKICLCNLIYAFTREDNTKITKDLNDSSIDKYSIICLLYYDSFQSEISKSFFLNTITEKLSSIGIPEKEITTINSQLISITNELNDSIQGINDLYSFLDKIGSIIKTEDNLVSYFSKGGFIDNFLRKCFNAFYKLTFEELSQLYQSLKQYNTEDKITLSLSNNENEKLFVQCFDNKELFRNIKDYISNFQQKCFFVSGNDASDPDPNCTNIQQPINDKLYNLYKFFDYNLYKLSNDETSTNPTIPSPNNDNKIHHSLLALVSFYYEQKCFDKAIQLLFECIKLSQSNCDHEALLKCFLWMTKIFIYAGNYSLATQCLSTCLIKSFQNNYHLIHLLSSVEFANLNYVFNATIGDSPNSLDEKIIAHSKNYIQLYKNILEYCTLNEDGENNNLDKLVHYALCHLILSLLEKGEHSLALNYLTNISLKQLFNKGLSPSSNDKCLSKEMQWSFAMFAVSLEDYEPTISFELLNGIITSKTREVDNELIGMLQLFIMKYISQYCNRTLKMNNDVIKQMGLFYEYQLEFYDLLSLYERNSIAVNIEKRLSLYIKRCDDYHFNRYKNKALVLLCKLYLGLGKISEAIVISKKLNEKADNRYETMTALISLSYCYYQIKNMPECNKCLSQIERCIEKIGFINDKFDYYYLKVNYMKAMKDNDIVLLKNNMVECAINAILLNNKRKIKKISRVMEEYDLFKPMLKIISDNFLPMNKKLFTLIEKYPLPANDVFNVIMMIHKNNVDFIEKWLKKID